MDSASVWPQEVNFNTVVSSLLPPRGRHGASFFRPLGKGWLGGEEEGFSFWVTGSPLGVQLSGLWEAEC